MMPTTVVHCRKSPYDVYIGRPGRGQSGKWGNPFALDMNPFAAMRILATCPGRIDVRFDGPLNREVALECYRQWIRHQKHLLADLHELRGKRLGCFCSPKACHGDVLAELADAVEVPL